MKTKIPSKKAVSTAFIISFIFIIFLFFVVYGVITVTTKGATSITCRIEELFTGESCREFEALNKLYIDKGSSWQFIGAADLDDQGRPELVFLRADGGAYIYSKDDEAWFTLSTFETSGDWEDFAIGDFDTSNNLLELAAIKDVGSGNDFIQLISITKSFSASSARTLDALDVAWNGATKGIFPGAVLEQPAGGGQGLIPIGLGEPPEEIVIMESSGTTHFYKQVIQREFTTFCKITPPQWWTTPPYIDIEALDYDGDDKDDLAYLIRRNENQKHIGLVNGNSILCNTELEDFDEYGENLGNIRDIATADFDEDGKSEIIVLYNDKVHILRTPDFRVLREIKIPSAAWQAVTAVDIAGDRELEVVVAGDTELILGYPTYLK
jgi:hypothetical protein